MDELNNQNLPDEHYNVVSDLITKALEGKHSKFEYLRCWDDLHIVNNYIRGVKTAINMFENVRKASLEVYIKQIQDGFNELTTLYDYKQFTRCCEYYQKELQIAKSMKSEYFTYIFKGHIIDTILGVPRKDSDCIDHRFF